MSQSPEQLIVHATIPKRDNPDARVLHIDGTEPFEVGDITTSQEELLRLLGKRVFASGYLTIDVQESRRNVHDAHRRTTTNISHLRTQAIDSTRMKLNDGYGWSDENK